MNIIVKIRNSLGVEALLDERNYLREALSKEQETSKVLSEQIANQDQRMGVVIAALSQNQPKELTEKEPEKSLSGNGFLGRYYYAIPVDIVTFVFNLWMHTIGIYGNKQYRSVNRRHLQHCCSIS